MGNLDQFLRPLIISPPDERELVPETRGRKRLGEKPMTGTERKQRTREKQNEQRKRCIAVLDMETDPFDHVKKTPVFPFLAILYSENFEPIIMWENDHAALAKRIIREIEALPDRYTIYAHNGGKFDYLFLVHKIRGAVKFKGRGIMCATIGRHELRDSFHIIPEKLAAVQKDSFDYSKLERKRRAAYRDEIIRYCLNDCRYLLDIVKKFVNEFGLKISIGQAAMYEIRKHYEVEKFSAGWDAYVRQFYFGGRVECLRGSGHFTGDYKLIDTNSMYPYVMANFRHPIGGFHDYEITGGPVRENTHFIELWCRNRGALIARDENGATTVGIKQGVFKTTIHEFNMAVKLGLISDIKIITCLNCSKSTTFEKFVLPLYNNRLLTKQILADMKRDKLDTTSKFMDIKKDDIFYKLLLNNGYGKFAQDPKRYKEHYITDPGEHPPEEWMRSIYELGYPECEDYIQPCHECETFWIWQKPSPGFRYNNVGTAASITGAARAVLMEALHNSVDPIYCDTDSIICKGWNANMWIDKTALGAWDLEDEFSEVIISGKKLYAVMHKTPKRRTAEELERGLKSEYTIKSKGVAGVTWQQMLQLLDGAVIPVPNRAPTLTKTGAQYYLTRDIRATAARL